MITNVQYPAVPTIGFRSLRGLIGTAVVFGTIVGILFFPWKFFFPALITYVAYGLAKTAVMGMLERRHLLDVGAPDRVAEEDTDTENGEIYVSSMLRQIDAGPESSDVDDAEAAADRPPARKRRRRRRTGRPPRPETEGES